jgi:hypothetical protein
MTDIVDCIIDGGGAIQVPCAEESADECFNSSTPKATAWNPSSLLALSADTKRVEELLGTFVGQQHFSISRFKYARGTGALAVYKNGELLKEGVHWVEQSPTSFSLLVPAIEGDVLIVVGYVGITGSVDIRETDIYVVNYQAVRDYAGTEELIYAQGQLNSTDGGGAFFQLIAGAAVATYTDDAINILIPTGGDGSSAWISRTAAITFTTLMALMKHPSLKIGDLVSTHGYYTELDKGGNVYVIADANFAVPDGGSYIFLPSSNVLAVAQFPGNEFNVKQWGALGDGVADDTLPIQTAIDSMVSIGGGELNFPASGGSYPCNLILSSGVSLIGDATNATLIPFLDAPVITIRGDQNVSRVRIESLFIDGTATELTFTNQVGILGSPQLGVKMDNIQIINCDVNRCGSHGMAFIGAAGIINPDGRIENLQIRDCTSNFNVLSGLHMSGNIGISSATNCEFANNGIEDNDDFSNVVVINNGVGIPESITFSSVKFQTTSYAAEGNALLISGSDSILVESCLFFDFFIGIKLAGIANELITVRNCKFKRDAGGDIVAAAQVDGCNVFTWDGNLIEDTTTGPLGLRLNSFGTFSIWDLDVRSNNLWGGVDKPSNDFRPSLLSGTDVNILSRRGIAALETGIVGTTDLDNIFDKNGGISQFVPGDTITLHISTLLQLIQVKHLIGNIRLDSGDFVLLNRASTIVLMWNSVIANWVEISRSTNAI